MHPNGFSLRVLYLVDFDLAVTLDRWEMLWGAHRRGQGLRISQAGAKSLSPKSRSPPRVKNPTLFVSSDLQPTFQEEISLPCRELSSLEPLCTPPLPPYPVLVREDPGISLASVPRTLPCEC